MFIFPKNRANVAQKTTSKINMLSTQFFTPQTPCQSFINQQPIASTDIKHILSHTTPNSLLILDIDDTIGRVSQTLGLDAWFQFRIQQYISEGFSDSAALEETIQTYNMAQLASPGMLPVDKDNDMAPLIHGLKNIDVKIIGLTARNHVLVDKTLSFLAALNITFDADILSQQTLTINGRMVVIKEGIIFASGNNKGACLEAVTAHTLLTPSLDSFSNIHFVDDSKRNCEAVANSLVKLSITNFSVWHYTYAQEHLSFDDTHKERAKVQEQHLLKYDQLLNDEQADVIVKNGLT